MRLTLHKKPYQSLTLPHKHKEVLGALLLTEHPEENMWIHLILEQLAVVDLRAYGKVFASAIGKNVGVEWSNNGT